jgi:hypothetical protein
VGASNPAVLMREPLTTTSSIGPEAGAEEDSAADWA